ncbi:MAG: hypothetical protein QOH17_1505, partial [Pseudonocardiales bacterium]|nr:hypothetical protein [Pseudonocardiales bacterium]
MPFQLALMCPGAADVDGAIVPADGLSP